MPPSENGNGADPTAETARSITFADAVLEAIAQSMDLDPRVLAMGVSIDDPQGSRGATGLVERYGKERVVGMPLSEDASTGIAIGLAMGGERPVQIHGRLDFMMLSMNQLVNVAAKIRGMYAGKVGGVPIVARGTIGRSWGQGAQHSQGLGSLFAHIPGLRVVMPVTPADAKASMAWALTQSQDPVVFIDHRMLHKTVGLVPHELVARGPETGARLLGTGSDITIVALSWMAVEAERAVRHLRTLGVSASLIDPLWLRPLNIEDIADDAARTRRLLVVDCGWTTYGFSAEVLAGVMERGNGLQIAARMGFAQTVCPTAKSLEALYYPNAETIAAKAFQMVTGRVMPKWDTTAAAEVTEFRGPF